MAQKKTTKPQIRLSAAERRQLIIQKAGKLFAQKGLHGVTTKEIAKACEVSEPVLYRHFKTKEEIYNELHTLCSSDTAAIRRALALRDVSTETLCFLVYVIVSLVALQRIPGEQKPSEESLIITRLAGYSFLEDGRFLRVVLRDCIGSLFDDWKKNYKAAAKAGDLTVESADTKDLWISYELIVGTALFHLTKPKALAELHGDDGEYLESITLFVLRGLGVKEGVLKKHFKPKDWVAQFRALLVN